MHYKIKLSVQFNFDLVSTYDYIYRKLKSPDAAKNLKKKILKVLSNLETLPEAFPRINLNQESNDRYIFCGNYVIIYSVEGHVVNLYRFLYAKSDIKNRLKED